MTAAYTAPGTPHARIRVRDGVPGTRREWVATIGRISGVLVALDRAGRAGEPLPAELTGRRVLEAWGRVSRPVLTAAGGATAEETTFALDAGDVAGLGRAVSALRGAADGHLDGTTTVRSVLRDEARRHGRTSGDLVEEITRVHALLAV